MTFPLWRCFDFIFIGLELLVGEGKCIPDSCICSLFQEVIFSSFLTLFLLGCNCWMGRQVYPRQLPLFPLLPNRRRHSCISQHPPVESKTHQENLSFRKSKKNQEEIKKISEKIQKLSGRNLKIGGPTLAFPTHHQTSGKHIWEIFRRGNHSIRDVITCIYPQTHTAKKTIEINVLAFLSDH